MDRPRSPQEDDDDHLQDGTHHHRDDRLKTDRRSKFVRRPDYVDHASSKLGSQRLARGKAGGSHDRTMKAGRSIRDGQRVPQSQDGEKVQGSENPSEERRGRLLPDIYERRGTHERARRSQSHGQRRRSRPRRRRSRSPLREPEFQDPHTHHRRRRPRSSRTYSYSDSSWSSPSGDDDDERWGSSSSDLDSSSYHRAYRPVTPERYHGSHRHHHQRNHKRHLPREPSRPSIKAAELLSSASGLSSSSSLVRLRVEAMQRQRNEAAKKIQKQTRKYLRKQEEAREVVREAWSRMALDELLEEYLVTELIPDLLIEIILNENHAFDPLPPEDQAVHLAADSITREAVAAVAKDIVEAQIADFIRGVLRRRQPQDPLKLVAEDVAWEVADSLVRGVAEEAILECSSEYLVNRRCRAGWEVVCEEVVGNLALEVGHQVYNEHSVLLAYTTVIDETVREETEEMVEDMVEDLVLEQQQIKYQQELQQVESVAAQCVLPRIMGQLLMGMIAKRGEDMVIRQLSEVIVLRLMAGRLLGMTKELDRRLEEVDECPALGLLLRELTDESALPIVLKELEDGLLMQGVEDM